ncbi:transporter associated domain-containing protein [Pseudarcicella hirudinis]
MNDVCRALGVDNDFFDKERGESESLGGMLIEVFSRFPHSGEEIELNPFKFRILAVDSRRIKKIKITRNVQVKDETSREIS